MRLSLASAVHLFKNTMDRLFQQVKTEYDRYRPVTVMLDGEELQVAEKMGLAPLPFEDHGALLLAPALEVDPDASVAVLGCGSGLLPAAVGRAVPQGQVWAADPNLLAVEAARCALVWNQIDNVEVVHTAEFRGQPGSFQAVLIQPPKGKEATDLVLAAAQRLLAPGGMVYVAGANKAGIKTVARMVEGRFGHVQTAAYRKGHRLLRAIQREAPAPSTPPAPTWELTVHVGGEALRLETHPGIFSWNKLDPGTAALLDALSLRDGARVLDLGCGYGVIALIAARRAELASLHAVDAHAGAVAATRRNLARYGVENSAVLASDAISAVRDERYDLVVTNPPFHASMEAQFATALAFIHGSAQVLAPDGSLVLVANQHIKYEPILARCFRQVETLFRDARFKVLHAQGPR